MRPPVTIGCVALLRVGRATAPGHGSSGGPTLTLTLQEFARWCAGERD